MTTAQRMILVTAMGVTAMLVLLPPWRYTLQSFDPDGGMTTEYVTEYAPLWNPPASGSRILIGSADATGARAMIGRPSGDATTPPSS